MTLKARKARLALEWKKTLILAKYILKAKETPEPTYMATLLKEMFVRANQTNEALLDVFLPATKKL